MSKTKYKYRKEPHKDDVICPICGKNCGHSEGAAGLLQLHNKFKHPKIFWEKFMRRSK